MSHLCERCKKAPKVTTLKFCKGCKRDVMWEMHEARYFTITDDFRQDRSMDQKEDVFQTKFGVDR